MSYPSKSPYQRSRSGTAIRDGIIVAVVTLAALILAILLRNRLDWFPTGLALPAIVFLAGLTVYFWRRWRELRSAIASGDWVESELFHQATHDALTKLPNRVLFFDRLRHAAGWGVRRETLVAVMLVDIDDLAESQKLDADGTNKLLVAAANRLQSCIRYVDTIGRFEGQRFGILLESIADQNEPRIVAERVLQALGAPFSINGREIEVRTSIGISVTAPTRNRPEDLLKDAEIALYHAQGESGSNYTLFDPGLNLQPIETSAQAGLDTSEHHSPSRREQTGAA